MKQLEKVQNNTTWAKASNAINNNNDALYVAVTTLEHAAFKNKGYFKSVALLYGAYPTAENGAQAFVYNSSNPTSAPYDIYEWVNGAWQDTGVNGGNVSVNLDAKQDTLVGYSESVSGGKATQVAIQGDAIALSGKVSLGNVDDMESAILMSYSQAGAAIAKANTLEQSMNAIKSPIKPIQLNSQGKLELNIGKGLYIEDGKLCTTGASGGGGGGTTLSEGQGIIIQDDKISVAYDIDTLRVNSCGGLTVNYGEGLAIKDGKLSALTSVTAGNGLVKKGEELSVNISTGLQYGSDGGVAVKTGKGLSVDNTGTINANIDNSTIATNSDGAMYVQKGMLAGQGLKVSLDRLAVNYGNGLTISNRALVVKHGAGLAIDSCGKLYSTVQGGKTYVAGDAIGFDGNNINVRYDGVTISTKNTADRSLHVMLGSGLKQGSNGIDVAVGLGLAIGSDNQIYCTVDGGTTYTAGDGIDISNGKISFKSGTSLESKCGYIQVAISSGLEYDPYNEYKIRVKAGDGIIIPNTGEVKASLGTGLAFGEFGAIKISDAVLTDISNLKESKQDALEFGQGLSYGNGKLEVLLDPYGGLNGCSSNGIGINVDYNSPLLLCDGLLTMDVDCSVLTVCGGVLGIQLGSSLIKSCDGISVNVGNGLRTNNCGEVEVDLYNIANPTGGLLYENGLAVNVGNGLKIDSCQVVVDYGTGLKVVNNKLDVDTSKIAGVGIDLDSDYKMLTIGTKAAQELAGKGLVADGSKIKVKYGSGLTTNSCGNLIVDAAKLTVGNANRARCADVAHGITYTSDGGTLTHGGGSFAWYNVYHSTLYTQGDCIILNLHHSYYYQRTASVTFAINVGYGDVNITQLGATPESTTYDKIRVRWVNDEVFVDVFIYSAVAKSDMHYVQGFGLGVFTPPKATSDTTGIISEFSIRPGYFYAQNASADVFLGNLTGTADKATADANGNNIADTYLKSVGASGDGISISGGKIAVKYCDGLQIANGSLIIATGDGLHIKDRRLAINTSDGFGFTPDGVLKLKLHGKSGLQTTSDGLGVNAGVALGTSDGKLNVQYGTGLKVVNNKLDVDTSKIAGVGIDLDSDYKMLTIGTKAAQELAGKGLVADGSKIKVKYGSGLTTNTCGKLIVDAANLTVGYADYAYYAPTSCSAQYASYAESAGHAAVSCSASYASSAGKATADANGNNIATTYAKHFWPGQGMNLSNDSVLSLPNLTASVANGAVDGVKNNNQRVLNLSCGTIQIKLSTGLAIDDNGYLYVQDKYVTK